MHKINQGISERLPILFCFTESIAVTVYYSVVNKCMSGIPKIKSVFEYKQIYIKPKIKAIGLQFSKNGKRKDGKNILGQIKI